MGPGPSNARPPHRLPAGLVPSCVCALVFLTLTPGCAWRTPRSEHLFGPALYRFNNLSTNSIALQTLHAPLLLEGGNQWGISLGGVQRFVLTPRIASATNSPIGVDAPRAWFSRSDASRWHLSLLYLRAPTQHAPVFIRRTIIGAHGGAGTEERALTLGYSNITATDPREDALYQIEFHSRRPMDATLKVTPAAVLITSNTNNTSNSQKGLP